MRQCFCKPLQLALAEDMPLVCHPFQSSHRIETAGPLLREQYFEPSPSSSPMLVMSGKPAELIHPSANLSIMPKAYCKHCSPGTKCCHLACVHGRAAIQFGAVYITVELVEHGMVVVCHWRAEASPSPHLSHRPACQIAAIL